MSERDRTYLQTPEQWTQFLSAFIHELRTPLASFRMLADLLAEAPKEHLGVQERRYSENIREAVQDIQALVGEAGELGRLLDGRVQIQSDEVHLEDLVNEVEEVVRPGAWEEGIALTDSLDSALPAAFRTDRDRLRQILVLLLNAVVGHAKSEVFFQLDIDGDGKLCAVVSSDGPAFPNGTFEAVFEPFHDGFRAARQRGGRSLALPLAKELARALGGVLRAENREGKPSFELSLPAAA